MTQQDNSLLADTHSLSAAKQFPLLRRFAITSLVAMLVTAIVLVYLYRQDQLVEHKRISERRNEQAATQLIHLLGKQINTLAISSERLDAQTLRNNPSLALFPSGQEIVRDYDILKLKIFNRSGIIIYSSVKADIGGTSNHPAWHARALSGEVSHKQEFRDTFIGATGEIHGIYLAVTYMPLVYEGKPIGAIEIYRDATPVFEHLNTNTIRIPLIVFGGFSLLFAALFFYVRRTDRTIAKWQQALLESENRRRLLEQQELVQTSLDGFFVVRTTDIRILDANEAFCNMVGYSREELLTMRLSELEADESPVEIAAHIKKIRESGYDRFETRHRHKQGHFVDIEISVSHSEMNGGMNFVFVRDISERKRMEKAIAAREQEFRSLAETSPDFIVRYDREGRHLYLNGRLLQLLGLASVVAVIGKRPGEVWTDGRFEELEQAAARAVESGNQIDIEIVQPTGNGAFRYHQIFIMPECDVSGRIVGTIAFGREITAIREAERKLKHFIDNLPGMAYTFRRSPDGHGCFPFISPSAEKFYGLKPEDVQDDMAPLHSCWHPDDQMHIEAAAAESARTMTPFRIEARVCRPGQPERWLEGRALPEREADGSILWYGLLLDITERKQHEEQLALLNYALDHVKEAVFLYGDDIRFSYVNAYAAKYLGYSREELLGMSVPDIDPDFQREQMLAHWRDIQAIGSESFESRHKTKSGHVFPVDVMSNYFESGGKGYSLALCRDITERKQAEAQLVQREREFRTLADSLPDNIVRYNREGVTVYVNPVLERTLGDLAAAMIGTTPREYHPDGSYEDYAQLLDKVLASGETGELEKMLPGPDGSVSFHQIRMVPERGESGEVVGVLAIGRDITERKLVEEALRASEQKFRSLAENLPDILIRYDREGRRTYVNPAMERIFTVQDKRMVGLTVQEANPLRLPESYQLALQHTLATGERSEFEMQLPAASGDTGIGFISITAERAEDGQIFGAIVIGRDITERKQAEEALRASEQRFRSLAENMPFILMRYDREGRRTYVNPSAERNFGFVGEQIIGKTLPEINPLKIPTVEAYQRALKHTLATGERSEFEMQVTVASGEVRIGNTVIVAERAADGQISGAITIGRDITKLKQTEQQLRELAAHIQTVREEEKARLAREIHDDLGSTLAALKLRLSHLLDFEFSEELKKTPLFTRFESMSQILDSAIAASRRIVTDMRPEILDNLGLFAALKWQAEQFQMNTGIECQFIFAGEHRCIDCKNCEHGVSQELTINLFRIFQEALTNVARHSGASKVEAEFSPGSSEVVFSIRDNGCGLPDGHVIPVTSFGMRGMRERVWQLGGSLEFGSPPGGGLRVTVRVPLSVVCTG